MILEERKETTLLFANWLKPYTHEVIIKVMEKKEENLSNAFAMNLLKELKEREEKEIKEFAHSIGNLIDEFETFKEFDPHNNPITHADSYRNVLYDMFIK